MFFPPKNINNLQIAKLKNLKVAGISKSPTERGKWNFVEDIYVNAGIQTKVFSCEEEALEWLTEGKPSTQINTQRKSHTKMQQSELL